METTGQLFIKQEVIDEEYKTEVKIKEEPFDEYENSTSNVYDRDIKIKIEPLDDYENITNTDADQNVKIKVEPIDDDKNVTNTVYKRTVKIEKSKNFGACNNHVTPVEAKSPLLNYVQSNIQRTSNYYHINCFNNYTLNNNYGVNKNYRLYNSYRLNRYRLNNHIINRLPAPKSLERCRICYKNFKSKIALNQHLKSIHVPRPDPIILKCLHCMNTFMSCKLLQEHKIKKHSLGICGIANESLRNGSSNLNHEKCDVEQCLHDIKSEKCDEIHCLDNIKSEKCDEGFNLDSIKSEKCDEGFSLDNIKSEKCDEEFSLDNIKSEVLETEDTLLNDIKLFNESVKVEMDYESDH